ncbi:MAG: response regulator transcription factor, partial [Flammeovirgaceae bacterium]
MQKIKLAVVDDSQIFRTTIIHVLKLQNDFEIVIQAVNGIDLMSQLKEIIPHIILMDIHMPRMDGIEATTKVQQLYPEIKIIALSQYDHELNIVEMYVQGVRSFIGKDSGLDELYKAIRVVSDGGAYMTDLSFGIIQKYLSKAQIKLNSPNLNQEETSL